MKIWDVTVIGAGPAGCGAAAQCRRLGLDVLLIERNREVGGLLREARLVENYPGLEKPLPGIEIASRLRDFLNRFQIETFTGEVCWIHKAGGEFIACTGSDVHRSRGVILATGTAPVQFDLPGNGPVRRSLHELLKDSPEKAAVIGGGEAALDYALNLSDRGCEVELIVRGGEFRADGTLPEEVKTRPNIGIRFNTTATGIEAAVEGVILHLTEKGGEYTIPYNAVLAAVGREPAFPILQDELCISGSSTQLPGLLVAGDLAEGALGQASTASGQGVRAAGLMAGYLKEKVQQ